jgi:hypothetical protein
MIAASSADQCATCAPNDGSSVGSVECWPGIVVAVASDPPPLVVGLSEGDVVTLTLSSPGDAVALNTTNLWFTPSIGVIAASWRSRTELYIRVIDTAGVNTVAADVARGGLTVSLQGVRSANGLSPASPVITAVVGGTWGTPSRPILLWATAIDSGHNVGLDVGDRLELVFDQAVAGVDVSTMAALVRVLAFTPPLLDGTGSPQCTGWWTNGTTVLNIVFTAFGQPTATRAWEPFSVGALVVTVLPAAGITSANGESAPSNSTIVVSQGTWGDAPRVTAVSTSATSMEITLAPPRTSYNVPVRLYVVQWSVDPGFGQLPPLNVTTSVVSTWAAAASWVIPLAAASTGSPSTTSLGVVAFAVGSDARAGTAIAQLSDSDGFSVADRATSVTFHLPGLTTSQPYTMRAVCNSVADTLSPIVPTAPSVITPQPPEVTSVSVLGGVLATAGGTALDIQGMQLGGASAVIRVQLSNGRFTFLSNSTCDIVTPAVAIRCYSPPGVGTNNTLTLLVDGTLSRPLAGQVLAYAQPVVLGLAVSHTVSSVGVDGVGTDGGSMVVITGAQFGPVALTARSLDRVTYSPGDFMVHGAPVTYLAAQCAIIRDDIEIMCTMASGVGSRLQWTVVIAGQASALPRTAYTAPIVTGIGVVVAGTQSAVNYSTAALGVLPTAGGQTLVFVGDFFGPAGMGIPIVAVGRQVGGNGVVTTASCVASDKGHTEVRCVSPPGVGTGYAWTLTVAGLASRPSLQLTSYAPPDITAVAVSGLGALVDEPGRVPTAGGATVTLTGHNLGDETGAISVLWNGIPAGGIVILVPHTVVSVVSLPGQGSPARLVLAVAGQATSRMFEQGLGSALMIPISVPYLRPRVVSLSLERPQGGVIVPLDCSLVDPDGRPTIVGSGTVGFAVLLLLGSNFGNGSDISVSIRSTPCELLLGRSIDDILACKTPLCNGGLVNLERMVLTLPRR